MDISYYQDIVKESLVFLESLKKQSTLSFYPSKKGLTQYGKRLELGFVCYALKLYKLTGEWDKIEINLKEEFIRFLNQFQNINTNFPENYFIDNELVNSYSKIFTSQNYKYIAKNVVNQFTKKNYPTKSTRLNEAVNAENKQVISTLHELERTNERKIFKLYESDQELLQYLNSLNWSLPWSAGAQFSSLCVYTATQNFQYEKTLLSFIDSMLNNETGSYHTNNLRDNRQVINGAMKVISGLDWLNVEIHKPKKLIDFCLNETPELEGCDIVDFVYVLYKCSQYTDYKRKEINNIFKILLTEIMKLYLLEDKGFSYYKNKSQTHYYGVKITKGIKTADIHGTMLCVWAIVMMLNQLDESSNSFKVIKP